MGGRIQDPLEIYSDRASAYLRFTGSFCYPAGLRAYFLGCDALRAEFRILDAGCGAGTVTLALRTTLKQRGFEAKLYQGFDLTPEMLDRFCQQIGGGADRGRRAPAGERPRARRTSTNMVQLRPRRLLGNA